MAWYAATGIFAAAGFATLAVVTAFCVVKGWQAATQHHFDEHRWWMLRCFVLLCSAVLLRAIGGYLGRDGSRMDLSFRCMA